MLKKLPINISDFTKLRNQNCLYVDKTRIIYELITREGNYFLSRPRRFGKSLLITTLREIFRGNKELFKDLWIAEHSTYDWLEHPVIHLDFSTLSALTTQDFTHDLNTKLNSIAASYDIDLSCEPKPKGKLALLVTKLSTKAPVVILIDEYDYPLLRNLNHQEKFTELHELLGDFFAGIKGYDTLLRAVLLTGVTKFAKTSIFSGMNNLSDLSLDPLAADLLGYTHSEIIHYFFPHLNEIAANTRSTVNALIDQITTYYNGYRFCEEEDVPKVYNPYSVLNFLKTGKFKNYWFATGTPSFLITLLAKQVAPLINIKDLKMSEAGLGSFDLETMQLDTILFQAGYITITDYDPRAREYTLNYPNKELQESYEEYLLVFLTKRSASQISRDLQELKNNLEQHKFEDFFTAIQCFIASIPNNLLGKEEKNYHSLFILLMRVLSFTKYSELLTDKGRIDTVIETSTEIFIFELKINQTPQIALQQIEDKKYYERYLLSRKKITLLGVNFDIKGSGIVIEHAIKHHN